MLKKMTVNLMVDDVQQTLKFYKENLNFTFVMGVPQDKNEVIVENDFKRKLVYAVVKHDSIEIMFQAKESLSTDISYFANMPVGASVSFYFEVEDVNSIYEKIRNKAKIVKDIHTTWYGMREFYIADCNGYILGFAKQEE